MFNTLKITTYFILLTTSFIYASEQNNKLLTAQESDPKVLNWMKGFPPEKDKLIMQP